MPKLDLLGIVTKDLTESLRFYALLGVDVPKPTEDDDHVEAVLHNGLRLAWDKVELMKQINPEWEEPVGHRLGLAFLCDSPTDVDDTFAKVTAAGFKGKMDPWDAFWGQRYAVVLDPDGNSIDLFAPLG